MPAYRNVVLFATLYLTALLTTPLAAEPPTVAPVSDADNAHEALLGAWAMTGPPESTGDPEPGAPMKFWGLKHWCVTYTDPDSGEIEFHHGGTYKLDGDDYTETVTFAAESTQQLIGMTFKFKIKIEGDVYLQTGVGNPYSERWVRLKQD